MKLLLTYLLFAVLLLPSCKEAIVPNFEVEGNALKRAAYDYNIQFVLVKKEHFKATDKYIESLYMADSTMFKWKAYLKDDSLSANYIPGIQFQLWDTDMYAPYLDTLNLIAPAVDTLWYKSTSNRNKSVYSTLISKNGWARIHPRFDTLIDPIDRKAIRSFYEPFMKEDTLVTYSAWNRDFRIDPIKQMWTYTCARTIAYDSLIYGWTFCEYPLEKSIESLKEYNLENMLLISNTGAIIYSGELASKLLRMSTVNPIQTNAAAFLKLGGKIEDFSVFHTKNEMVRQAMDNIVFDQSEIEIIKDDKIAILAADIGEIKAKLVYVIQY